MAPTLPQPGEQLRSVLEGIDALLVGQHSAATDVATLMEALAGGASFSREDLLKRSAVATHLAELAIEQLEAVRKIRRTLDEVLPGR